MKETDGFFDTLAPSVRIVLAILITLLSGFYFLPTSIAIWRGHRSLQTMFIVNLLLGWTVFAWIILLVWSFQSGSAGSTRQGY